MDVDVVIPVWNNPVETRACLVSLVTYSTGIRLILVDNGSDRETEALLEEFADSLNERALLLRSEVNDGPIRAINRGMLRATSPLVAVIKPTTCVADGWLEPVRDVVLRVKEAGIVVPAAAGGKPAAVPWGEADHGSFSAMVLRKALHDQAGGFDEGMDGGEWCLRDYSRRALRLGYTTVRARHSVVTTRREISFGSPQKRRALLEASEHLYAQRWGVPHSYLLAVSKEQGGEELAPLFGLLLEGARQGSTFTLLLPRRLHGRACSEGLDLLHENISAERVPFFGGGDWIRKRAAAAAESGTTVVSVGGSSFGSLSLRQLEQDIRSGSKSIYGLGKEIGCTTT